ncbi:BEM_HP_G0078940.mRNA.1.CDS.1 [Saccharomyces cerevisiae]|nr:BEM_HP_G0078940.mRNA.1.CDS.1 [Saccharomyces cerevisiae]CAI6990903.1 BEM_HP_G0078940.mRNA.1.CDS.1 [Saccharomyces cerevisiae]
MDIFRVLTRGSFLLERYKWKDENHKEDNNESQIVKELDFFRNKRIISKVEDDREKTTENDSPNKEEKSGNDDGLIKTVITNTAEASKHIPLPIGSFEDLISRFSFDRRLLNNLIENGLTEPTPIQCECIPAALNNRDVLACGPIGSGKTLAFLIPLVQQIIDDKQNGGVERVNHFAYKRISEPNFY